MNGVQKSIRANPLSWCLWLSCLLLFAATQRIVGVLPDPNLLVMAFCTLLLCLLLLLISTLVSVAQGALRNRPWRLLFRRSMHLVLGLTDLLLVLHLGWQMSQV